MSRIQIFGFVIVLLLTLLTVAKNAQADTPVSNCPNPATADPADLNSKSGNAQFTVNMDGFYDRAVTRWEAEFECGWRHQTVSASSNPDNQSVTASRINRSRDPLGGCEFFPGTHTLLIKGDNIPRCRADYTVVDADLQCILTIDPSTNPPGITPETVVKVSGQNLTEGGQFNLYIDDNDKLAGYVNTPDFSPITIPKEKLSPIMHAVYLRRDNDPWGLWTPLHPEIDRFGPVLCPVQFTVGTTDHPGGVIPKPSGGGIVPVGIPCIGPGCSISGGDPCDTGDGRGPALKTAIGCIHTSPAEFAKDFLTFIIGIGGGLAFLMMLIGAFQMLTSAGNPETLNAGRQRLTSAIIGLLFVIFAVLLLQIIGFRILNIPGFQIT